jgi:dipeptidyl-peptidase-4
MRSFVLLFLILPFLTIAQKKQVTLEDIFKKNTFRGEFVPGFVTDTEDHLFNPQDVVDASGKQIETREFQVSADKKRILFFNGREPIYRRSSKSTVYVYDVATKKSVLLNNDKVLHPGFSPDGSRLAYVFDNNLYV